MKKSMTTVPAAVLLAALLVMTQFVVAQSAQSPSPAQERKAREMASEGNRLYDQGEFAEAEIFFRKALEQSQSMTEGMFNLGNTTYRQDRFEEAATRFGEVAARTDLPANARAEAYYNQGNAFFEGEDYRKATEAYKQSLRLKPGDENAKHNLSLAQTMLKKQEQEQQNQENQDQKQDQQDQQDQQQKQDQQNQDQQNQENQDQQNPQNPEQDPNAENPQQDAQERNMSPEELERILEALEQDEKDVQKKVNAQKVKGVRGESEKDW
jgi:tetratricopeptide (TPR) repeat protein